MIDNVIIVKEITKKRLQPKNEVVFFYNFVDFETKNYLPNAAKASSANTISSRNT